MCYNKSISIILNGLEAQGYDSIIRAYVQILALLLMMQPLFRTFCPELAGSCTLYADHLFSWRVLQIVTRKLMNNQDVIWKYRSLTFISLQLLMSVQKLASSITDLS